MNTIEAVTRPRVVVLPGWFLTPYLGTRSAQPRCNCIFAAQAPKKVRSLVEVSNNRFFETLWVTSGTGKVAEVKAITYSLTKTSASVPVSYDLNRVKELSKPFWSYMGILSELPLRLGVRDPKPVLLVSARR